MNSSQKINLFFDKLDERFTGIPAIIADTATEYFKERFIRKNWEGSPWPAYKNPKREPKKGSLMMRQNNLFSSVRPSVIQANRVTISAGSGKIRYARTHNEGLRVRGIQYVRPHTNSNFMGKGKRVQVKGHSRKIDFQMPKRQFMGASQILNNQIVSRLKNHFNSK